MTNIDIRTGNGEWTYNDYLNEKHLNNDKTSDKVNTSNMLRTDSATQSNQANASREQTINTVIEVLNDKKNLENYRREVSVLKFIRNVWVAVGSVGSVIIAENTVLQIAPQYNPYHWFAMPLLSVALEAGVVAGSVFAAYFFNREKKRTERDAKRYRSESSLKDVPFNQI